MGIEIERKFLVNKQLWNEADKPVGKPLKQRYLLTDIQKTIRVRTIGNQGFITIKGKLEGLVRSEYEYEIPFAEAEEIMEKFGETGIEKIRYHIEYKGKLWEVDVFGGLNKGLIVAEVELESETESFSSPIWLGEEVSFDPKYLNANLQKIPYSEWKEEK